MTTRATKDLHVIPSAGDIAALETISEFADLDEKELDKRLDGANPVIADGLRAMGRVARVVAVISKEQPVLLASYAAEIIAEIEPVVGLDNAREVALLLTRSLATARLLADAADGSIVPLAVNAEKPASRARKAPAKKPAEPVEETVTEEAVEEKPKPKTTRKPRAKKAPEPVEETVTETTPEAEVVEEPAPVEEAAPSPVEPVEETVAEEDVESEQATSEPDDDFGSAAAPVAVAPSEDRQDNGAIADYSDPGYELAF